MISSLYFPLTVTFICLATGVPADRQISITAPAKKTVTTR